jgi:glyoxylase I family protein
MPELMGFSHVSLSVRDREKSAAFYADVFGFQTFQRLTEEDFDEIVLVHPVGMVLCLQQHC